MKSDAEFYLREYGKLRALYVNCPAKSGRYGEFYRQMMESMRKAYAEARKESR